MRNYHHEENETDIENRCREAWDLSANAEVWALCTDNQGWEGLSVIPFARDIEALDRFLDGLDATISAASYDRWCRWRLGHLVQTASWLGCYDVGAA
jgi:hypothetical protein